MKRWLAPLVLLALAALGVLGWFVVRRGGTRDLERADNPIVALPGETQAQLAEESQPLEARAVETGQPEDGERDLSSARVPRGTLRLRVLDAATRAPVADIGFLVYQERNGAKDLARGHTDAEGRATIERLEENTILVRTERKPPYASQTGGVWLSAGRTQELELLVGPGGAITGRVVDDRELPLAGAAIYVGTDDSIFERAAPDAQSGSDGRFRVECAASHPMSVWIVEGEMRPERWAAESVGVEFEGVYGGAGAEVVPGKDVDVGDIQLDRAATFAGRVVDAQGVPAAGALFSPHVQRAREGLLFGSQPKGTGNWAPLGDPAFALRKGEQLLDAAGRFELRGNPRGESVVVQTLSGQSQLFNLPQTEPAARRDGIELVLDPHTKLEIELVDAKGELLRGPAEAARTSGLWAQWRSGTTRRSGISLLTYDKNGRRRDQSGTCGADGIWRVELNQDASQLDELVIALGGYEPVTDRLEGGLGARARLRYVLTELPSLRLRLSAKDPSAPPLTGSGGSLQLHACLAPPERHAELGGMNCCGFGIRWTGNWRGELRVLLLPVKRKAAFWVYARGWRPERDYQDVASFGPFEPGEEEHALVLDPRDFPAMDAQREAVRKPPEALAPGEDHSARVSARIVDARSGKAVAGARLQFVEVLPPPLKSWGSSASADAEGEVKEARVKAGQWTISASGERYRRFEVGVQRLEPDQRVDLGAIALEPLPVFKGRVLNADGTPLADGWVISAAVGTLDDTARLFAATASDGSFEILDGLPPRLLLTVQGRVPSNQGLRFAGQRFALDAWPQDEVKELRLAPMRQVFVNLVGLEPESSELVPQACPAPGDPAANCDHRNPGEAGHNPLERGSEIDRRSEPRRYVFLLAPGRYQFWGRNLMHELPVTEFEVQSGSGDLELTIGVH